MATSLSLGQQLCWVAYVLALRQIGVGEPATSQSRVPVTDWTLARERACGYAQCEQPWAAAVSRQRHAGGHSSSPEGHDTVGTAQNSSRRRQQSVARIFLFLCAAADDMGRTRAPANLLRSAFVPCTKLLSSCKFDSVVHSVLAIGIERSGTCPYQCTIPEFIIMIVCE
jgi:hypothetical protein